MMSADPGAAALGVCARRTVHPARSTPKTASTPAVRLMTTSTESL
jgi:hypothetical protein